MPTFAGGNGAFTPSTSQDNWILNAGSAGLFGKVVAFSWGGRLTTSTGYRTRWTRPTTGASGTFTSLTPAVAQPNYAAPGLSFGTYATAATLAGDPAGNLWAQDWNAQGGSGAIVLPLANPWWVVNAVLTGQISCRNVAGTDANGSTYGLTWEE
jgi:hypothetical protein